MPMVLSEHSIKSEKHIYKEKYSMQSKRNKVIKFL